MKITTKAANNKVKGSKGRLETLQITFQDEVKEV